MPFVSLSDRGRNQVRKSGSPTPVNGNEASETCHQPSESHHRRELTQRGCVPHTVRTRSGLLRVVGRAITHV